MIMLKHEVYKKQIGTWCLIQTLFIESNKTEEETKKIIEEILELDYGNNVYWRNKDLMVIKIETTLLNQNQPNVMIFNYEFKKTNE